MALGRVFPNEVDRLFNAPGGPIGKEVRAVAIEAARIGEILAEMQLGKHPMDAQRTGRYKRSFQVKVVGRSTHFELSNKTPYAAALESGSRPHAIRAKRVKNLQFRDRTGAWRRVKMVRHPGNPAFRIMERSIILAMRRRYGSVRVT
jgi:hypothetical protein